MAESDLRGQEVAWSPDPTAAGGTNLGRFMEANGFETFSDLRSKSIDEPEWFWGAVVEWLGVRFDSPYEKILDTSEGIAWATWFTGGTLNAAELCLDRHADAAPDKRAVVWEGEDGQVRSWTFAELRAQCDGLVGLLAERGVGLGDTVGVYLPMMPETVAAVLAVAKLGAVFLPLFSGYGPEAIALRLADAEAKAVITADVTLRRGRVVALRDTLFEALGEVPSVATVVVVPRFGTLAADDDRQVAWPPPAMVPTAPVMVGSEHPLFIAYTSGTTGKPKGSVHVHGGFVVKVAEEAAFQFDCCADDTLFWFTDLGWIMGPWQIFGALANGAAVALVEGVPDYPDPGRLWAFIERHKVSILGISPTLVRSLMAHGSDPVLAHDRSSLRMLGSTGEPWNLGPWRWYFQVVGEGRCPVINISGGTEVGACFLSPHPLEPIKPMSLGGPGLGMAVDVFDEEGQPIRGTVGELVCTKPWPGMTRGLYRDPDRYLETYWRRFPGVWTHGDWASVDADGFWFLHGRSDDTIKVAGKRLGPAEPESILVSHPAVLEAVAVGVPDELKGQVLWCFVVLAAGWEPADRLRDELTALVGRELGKAFAPAALRFTRALPKTRNAKVLRRAVRSVVNGTDPGDLSALEDPAAVEAVRAAR